jgi:hypothetical protein
VSGGRRPAQLAVPDDPMNGIDAERLRLLLLREIFTAAGGAHQNFAAYDQAMAAERSTAILVTRCGCTAIDRRTQ